MNGAERAWWIDRRAERIDEMKCLLLCCRDDERWAALPPPERERILRDYGELLRSLDASGKHVASAALGPVAASATVRARSGRPVVTDGPFAETKEQLGGFRLIECADRDEAVAKRMPTRASGGAVKGRAHAQATRRR